MKQVYLKINSLSPISHLAPPTKGSIVDASQRMLKVVVNTVTGKKIEKIPVVSGGSIRGKNRRKFIVKVLSELGYYRNNLLYDLKQETFEALIAGGRQVGAGSKPHVEKYISTYSDLPFFGLFGGTPYSNFFEGRLSVGFAIPMLQETQYLLEKTNSPFATDELPSYTEQKIFWDRHSYVRFSLNNIAQPEEVDFSDLLGFLKEKGYNEAAEKFGQDIIEYNEMLITEQKEDAPQPSLKLSKLEAELKNDEKLRGELGTKLKMAVADHTAAKISKKIVNMYNIQMIYEVINPIPAGLDLHAIVGLKPGLGDDKLMQATFDAFIETILEDRYIGGINNKGYGQVIIEAKTADGKNFMDTSEADYFWNWLKENKEKVKKVLESLDKYLVTAPEK